MIKLYILVILFFHQTIQTQADSTEFVVYRWLGINAETAIHTFEVELSIIKGYK